MRYMYAKFKNYIGFYNGLGLYELEIDMSKAVHNVVLIAGKNGCGKSTLRKALNILPDGSDSYIPNMEAGKELHILDNGDMYVLRIVSSITSSGHRATTKAYISKNGLELNPNGNVTSYKENLFSEFELDPNYISLSTLSSEDKGLATKTPGERKRYVSSIINSLEVYNSMNKVFSKKASVCKSQLNSVSGKIKQLGDEMELRTQLSSIENRYESIKNSIDTIKAQIIEAESYVKILDPNNELQEKYTKLYTSISECNTIKDRIEKEYDTLCIPEDINVFKEVDNLTNLIHELEYHNTTAEENLSKLIISKEEDIHTIDIKKEKINNMKSEDDSDKLRELVQSLREFIKSCESEFRDSNITNLDVSRDEYVYAFDTLHKIKDAVITFTSSRNESLINDTINHVNEIDNILEDKIKIDMEISKYESDLSSLKNRAQLLESNIKTMSILDKKPSTCNTLDCPFIKSAVEIQETHPDIELDNTLKEINSIEKSIIISKKNKEYIYDLYDSVKELRDILNMIDNPILDKVEVSKIFRDMNEFMTRLRNGNRFNEIEDNREYIRIANLMTQYKESKEQLSTVETELYIAENKNSAIEELSEELCNMIEKLSGIEKEILKLNNGIEHNRNIISKHSNTLARYKKASELLTLKEEIISRKENYFKEYSTIKSNIAKIKESIDKINYYNTELDRLKIDISPLENQKRVIEHNLLSLSEYVNEYNQYSEQYNFINILKKYSTPTDEGIQTLFMDIYMSKTLTTCNEILSYLFEGTYKLCKYQINSNEFRIPFIGEGLEVDDISNGSDSQVAMIGMIINLVLKSQSSSKFNIAFLDELDGPLDTYNRMQFVLVVYKLIELLQIEQLVMISHSIELDMSNVDVICLKGYENEIDKFKGANIIYDYRNNIIR